MKTHIDLTLDDLIILRDALDEFIYSDRNLIGKDSERSARAIRRIVEDRISEAEECIEERASLIISMGLYDSCVELMDDEIRERLHATLSPCTDHEFLEQYMYEHEKKYGKPFEI